MGQRRSQRRRENRDPGKEVLQLDRKREKEVKSSLIKLVIFNNRKLVRFLASCHSKLTSTQVSQLAFRC